MNEKTTIRFVLTGVKYSQSDLGKHYKTFCGLYFVRKRKKGCILTHLPLLLICISARCPLTVIRIQIGASPFFRSLDFLMKKRIVK